MLKVFFKIRENRFLRFIIAGGANTVFGFIIYSICILTGSAVWVALLISTTFGTAFNFLTASSYVFRELSLSRIPRFIICYLIIYLINLMLIDLVSIWLKNMITAQAIISLPLASLSYILMKHFVFLPSQ